MTRRKCPEFPWPHSVDPRLVRRENLRNYRSRMLTTAVKSLVLAAVPAHFPFLSLLQSNAHTSLWELGDCGLCGASHQYPNPYAPPTYPPQLPFPLNWAPSAQFPYRRAIPANQTLQKRLPQTQRADPLTPRPRPPKPVSNIWSCLITPNWCFLNLIWLYLCLLVAPVRTPRVRRSSGAAVLVNSIKKKFEHLRRSFSTDRLGPATTPASPKKLNTLQMNKVEKATPIRPAEPICDLLRRFTDGSCLIQLRRQDTSVHFGIYIRRDEKGLYVSRISGLRAKRDPRGKQYLQVGDRVVEVQNVPAKGLEPDTVRGLLQGCHVATIRVKSPNSSRKFNQPRWDL